MVHPDLFNEVPLVQLLDAEERRVLAEQVSIQNFKKGEIIYKAGDSSGLAYLIQKGVIHVTITDANYENNLLPKNYPKINVSIGSIWNQSTEKISRLK